MASSIYAWQGGTERGSRPMFGATAQTYDDIRPGYSSELVDRVMAYARDPDHLVEVGAGTGKATVGFAKLERPIECIEPDREMADVLRRRFSGTAVRVACTRFEDWTPAAGTVPLLYCAQAWHWLDSATRCEHARRCLDDFGALALFGHRYLFADEDVEAAVDRVYLRHAPHLVGAKSTRAATADRYWYTTELADCGLFQQIAAESFDRVVGFSVERFLTLTASFSSHRALEPATLSILLDELRAAIEEPVVDVQLATVLTLARAKPRAM